MTEPQPSATFAPFAPVLIRLLQGVVHFDDESTWTLLLRHRKEIDAHFKMIGIRVVVSEADGYAFLSQERTEESDDLPNLMHRYPLNYTTTLLCVLLRERLLQHDTGTIDSPRLVVSQAELYEGMRPFLPDKTDDTRLLDSIDRAVNRVKDMGFLQAFDNGTGEPVYEVRRILKAQISAEALESIKNDINRYASSL
jgi:hypothetical protein